MHQFLSGRKGAMYINSDLFADNGVNPTGVARVCSGTTMIINNEAHQVPREN
jgi:hypothetical protein